MLSMPKLSMVAVEEVVVVVEDVASILEAVDSS